MTSSVLQQAEIETAFRLRQTSEGNPAPPERDDQMHVLVSMLAALCGAAWEYTLGKLPNTWKSKLLAELRGSVGGYLPVLVGP